MRKRISYLLSALVALMLTAIACGGGGKKEEPKDVAVISVSIQATLTLDVGDTQKLTPAFNPSNATNKNVTWSTSAAAIANVSNDGAVTALGAGSATITVTTADGNKTSRCDVTVTVPVASISLNESEITLLPGGQRALQSTVLPANATNKQVSWSSNYPAIAEVSDNGIVTAKAAGEAVITAVSKQDTTKKAECAVTVLPIIPVTGINLNKTQLTLDIGQKETLTATVLPTNATNPGLVWSSDSPASVSVTQEGEVTALAAGAATIKAASAANPDVKDECVVYVDPAGPKVYVAGKMNDKAHVWVNNRPQLLDFQNAQTSDAKSVFVSDDGKVYAAGYAIVNSTITPALFVDGTSKNVFHNSNPTEARSVFVADDVIHVVGAEQQPDYPRALHWMGDAANEPISLSTNVQSEAHSVYVANGISYIAGRQTNSTVTDSLSGGNCIWRSDGERGDLSTPQMEYGEARSVFPYNGNVYAAGTSRHSQNGRFSAVLWTTRTTVTTYTVSGSTNTQANAVYVSGDKLYMAGTYTNSGGTFIAALWEFTLNAAGTAVQGTPRIVQLSNSALAEASLNAQAKSIFVVGDDVYVVGYEQAMGASSTPENRATIWKGSWGGAYTATRPNGEMPSDYSCVFVK